MPAKCIRLSLIFIAILWCIRIQGAHSADGMVALRGSIHGDRGFNAVTAYLLRNGEELISAKVTESGEYAFPHFNVQSGCSYAVEFRESSQSPAYYVPTRVSISIEPVALSEIEIQPVALETGGCLRLKVYDRHGNPLSGERIVLNIPSCGMRQVRLSEDGVAYISLPSRRIPMLQVIRVGTFSAATLSGFTVEAGKIAEREVRLDVGPEDEAAPNDVSGKDLRGTDLQRVSPANWDLSFDTNTLWPDPSSESEISPQAILDWGKNPGLGVRTLHDSGYTGKGVNVAYIDEPLLLSHESYADRRIQYLKVWGDTPGMNEPSLHGSMVTSILLGRDVGVAPDCTLYYVASPPWLLDQRSYADAIELIVGLNSALPTTQKIRAIGISDAISREEAYPGAFRAAIEEAENQGILVLYTERILMAEAIARPFSDKDNPESFKAEKNRQGDIDYRTLFIPSSGLTAAVGSTGDDRQYMYFSHGGLSMSVPYLLGVLALGWQANPELSYDAMLKLLNSTARQFGNGAIIDPIGFVDAARRAR